MKTTEKKGIFNRLFSTGSHGCSGECHCGIIHYDIANSWDDDHHENTLPLAEKSAKESPELYQFQDNSIEYLNFNGFLYVLGCRCEMDCFIFNILNEERENIFNFYNNTKDKVELELNS